MIDIFLKGILCVVVLSMIAILFIDDFFPNLEELICVKIMPKVFGICFVVSSILLIFLLCVSSV